MGTSSEAEGDDGSSPPPLVVAAGTSTASRLVAEASRELSAVKSSRYRHHTHVDEAAGVFEYDCSGFVTYALSAAAPDALAVIPLGKKGRPKAENFALYFTGLTGDAGPWQRVARANDLQPGDVIAWLKPAEIDSSNTGHVVIVLEAPKPIPASEAALAIGGTSEWLVRVADSTESPHRDDTRASGLGVGTIGIITDGAGSPLGYRWKGGHSPKAYATTIGMGRLR